MKQQLPSFKLEEFFAEHEFSAPHLLVQRLHVP